MNEWTDDEQTNRTLLYIPQNGFFDTFVFPTLYGNIFVCTKSLLPSLLFAIQRLQVIWWRNEKARPKNFNAVSHNHVRS